jgi:hypothetical protein
VLGVVFHLRVFDCLPAPDIRVADLEKRASEELGAGGAFTDADQIGRTLSELLPRLTE